MEIFIQFEEKPSFLGLFKKIGTKNRSAEIQWNWWFWWIFEKFQIFYTQIIDSNFLYYACIRLIFVFYERGKNYFKEKNKKSHHRFFITLLRRARKCPNMAKIPKLKFLPNYSLFVPCVGESENICDVKILIFLRNIALSLS